MRMMQPAKAARGVAASIPARRRMDAARRFSRRVAVTLHLASLVVVLSCRSSRFFHFTEPKPQAGKPPFCPVQQSFARIRPSIDKVKRRIPLFFIKKGANSSGQSLKSLSEPFLCP